MQEEGSIETIQVSMTDRSLSRRAGRVLKAPGTTKNQIKDIMMFRTHERLPIGQNTLAVTESEGFNHLKRQINRGMHSKNTKNTRLWSAVTRPDQPHEKSKAAVY